MSQQRDVRHFRYDATGLRGKRMRLIWVRRTPRIHHHRCA